MSKKILATYYDGATEQRRCSISQRLFDQEGGLQFKMDGEPISKEVAEQHKLTPNKTAPLTPTAFLIK